MSNEIARQKAGVPIITTPDELQKYMMKLVENKDFAERYKGIVDRKTLFLAVQAMRNLWWQIKDPSKFDFGSVIVAAGQAAAYGWSVDGITGHAYLIPYGNSVKLQPGYKGWIDFINRAGKCSPSMEAVYEGDTFEYRGRFKEPLHVRSKHQQRRAQPLTHVYVLAGFTNGIVKCFCWTKEECIAHRDRFSKGWRGVRGTDREADNPWSEKHPGFWVMCAKSVLSDAARHGELPLSVEHQNPALPPIDLSADDDAPETIEAIPFHAQAAIEGPGDDIAADAQREVTEQMLPPTLNPQTDEAFDPAKEMREKILAMTDPAKAADLAQDAEALGLLQLLDDKVKALRAKAGGRRQTKLPGE